MNAIIIRRRFELITSGFIRGVNIHLCDNLLLEIINTILIYCDKFEIDDINPDPAMIETTEMAAKRLNDYVFAVVHDVDWSKVLDIDSNWEFNALLKQKIDEINDGFTVPILSHMECKKLIELSELYGYVDCGNLKVRRNNTRMVTNDRIFAAKLYRRIESVLPKQYVYNNKIWNICGLNERLRFCRYTKGQKFDIHYDEQFVASNVEKSYYTLVIYLNNGAHDYKGGRLGFFASKYSENDLNSLNHDRLVLVNAVTPQCGLAAIFNHFPQKLYHSGEQVYDGVKYLIQTEIMYRLTKNSLHR